MKSRLIFIVSALAALLFLGACNSYGVSSEEYTALEEKYHNLQADYDALQKENVQLVNDLQTILPIVENLELRLNGAYGYSQFFDIYADIFRFASGQPTKYHYQGAEPGEEYLNLFYEYAYYAGGDELVAHVDAAFHLPKGEEKDKAFAELQIYLAEALMNATYPEAPAE